MHAIDLSFAAFFAFLRPLFPALLIILGVLWAARALWLGVRLIRDWEHPDAAFWLARAIRGIVGAVACACIAAGLIYAARGLLLFGIVFLAEELYETGMILLLLRLDRRLNPAKA